MGDPKKQRRKYETPKHPWRATQLGEELKLIQEYGLRNKKELWKYRTEISRIRGIARTLLARTGEDRARTESDIRAESDILARLGRLGVLGENATLDNVLDLEITDILGRRLQTVVARGGIAKSPHQARQMIVHGHVSIKDRNVTIPSYMVSKEDESHLKVVSPPPDSQREEKEKKPRKSSERPSKAAE